MSVPMTVIDTFLNDIGSPVTSRDVSSITVDPEQVTVNYFERDPKTGRIFWSEKSGVTMATFTADLDV